MAETKVLAHQVNQILASYVAVHNDIFKFSFRRVIPIPGLFQAIDYCSHEATLRDLAALLTSAVTAAGGVEPGSESEGAFLEGVTQYAEALLDTILRLQEVSSKLCQKSHGARGYRYDTYDADVSAYDVSVKRYVALGQRLNELYAAM